LPPVGVLGHSFGAEVAAVLAADYPQSTAALVLAAPTGDPTAQTRHSLVRRFLHDVPIEAKLQAPILVRDVWDAGLSRVWTTVQLSAGHRLEGDLIRVTVPSLVLGGARDAIAPVAWIEEAARLLGGAPCKIMGGCAHNLATTAAPEVADVVESFLAQITATSAGA
jgi:pimeloyl-ACP methyl ester carboxylesterase